MDYLISELWPFMIAALAIGILTGWLAVSPPRS